MTFDPAVLNADLIRDEGVRLEPYLDTAGKWTIGVGRNLTDRGIGRGEAFILLDNDIAAAAADLDGNVPWWRDLSDGRQRALLNMIFNMGWPRISGFRSMLAALESGDYVTAAEAALDSAWARQVGDRAVRIAGLIRRG
jgi:lysozyme